MFHNIKSNVDLCPSLCVYFNRIWPLNVADHDRAIQNFVTG